MASLTTPEDLRRLVADIIGEPFRLAQAGGPCRAVLLRNEDGRDSVLVVVAHHIVTDFVTHGAMVSELLEMYTALALGEQPETQPPRPYTDYARDVRAMNEGRREVPPERTGTESAPPFVLRSASVSRSPMGS